MASRFDFGKFSAPAETMNEGITLAAQALEKQLEALPDSRYKSLALTELEKSIMWARKALRDVN